MLARNKASDIARFDASEIPQRVNSKQPRLVALDQLVFLSSSAVELTVYGRSSGPRLAIFRLRWTPVVTHSDPLMRAVPPTRA